MRLLVPLLLLALPLWAAPAPSLNPGSAERCPEVGRLQGVWVRVRSWAGGRHRAAPAPRTLEFVGARVRAGAVWLEAVLDPVPGAKRLDLTVVNGPRAGQIRHCLYRLEGDTLILCFPGPRQRPTSMDRWWAWTHEYERQRP
jgi:uncharacterized protein (TIGR03067 family)